MNAHDAFRQNALADCPIIIFETYCGVKRDCLLYQAAIQDQGSFLVQDGGWPAPEDDRNGARYEISFRD